MRCPNCNAEIGEGKRFCPHCGTQIAVGTDRNPARRPVAGQQQSQRNSQQQAWNQQPQNYEPAKKKRGHGGLIAVIVVIFVLLAGGGLGFGVVKYLTQQAQERKHEQLLTMLEGDETSVTWLSDKQKKLNDYPLSDEEQKQMSDYEKELKDLEELDDYDGQMKLVEQIQTYIGTVETRLNTEAQAKLDELKNMDLGYASAEQIAQADAYADQMDKLIQNQQYGEIQELADTWSDYVQAAAAKKTGYAINITQYDFTEFPKVRMYLDIRDSGGNVVKELSPNMFYISERDAGNGDFLARTVEKAVIMNENERLNINMLADTSGSMSGSSLISAKQIMKNFLNTVQFTAGDQVKLTEFNSVIDKNSFFTGNINSLYSLIDSYDADGQTKLYDAIVYGVQDASGQEGARCVIAFTDGADVGSYNSVDDVVNVVSRYRIPVFIVRIGDNSYSSQDSELRRIAEASGGSFTNLQQFSTDMYNFYNQIYRQMKEYYVVEFEDSDALGVTKSKEYDVYVQNDDMGGEAVSTATPGQELFDSLLGAYLRSYILDMNAHQYNYLTQYVDATTDPNDEWSIQWQMKKQVSGGFNNVSMETLMDYYITSMEVISEDTVHIKTTEDYDVVYDEIYSDIQGQVKTIHKTQLEFMNSRGCTNLSPYSNVRLWARVRQFPEYIIKRGSDGKWRFSKYTGDLGLNIQRDFYDVEYNY
jgi:Mg-chelatase subunit ChlD